MIHLNLAECLQVAGGEASSELPAVRKIGQVVGFTSGALLATPLWLGVVVFGANGLASGRELSNSMLSAGLATSNLGCQIGDVIGEQIYNTYTYFVS